MAEEKDETQPTVPNVVTDKTGQMDVRFLLWRVFCADNNIPVETLPGDLSGEAKEKWEQAKEKELKIGDEQKK